MYINGLNAGCNCGQHTDLEMLGPNICQQVHQHILVSLSSLQNCKNLVWMPGWAEGRMCHLNRRMMLTTSPRQRPLKLLISLPRHDEANEKGEGGESRREREREMDLVQAAPSLCVERFSCISICCVLYCSMVRSLNGELLWCKCRQER